MQRILWAIKCFFLVLFAARLPAGAVEAYAPAELLAKGRRALPAPEPAAGPPPEKIVEIEKEKIVEKIVEVAGPDRRADGAVQALGVLQREGRLLDFLLEDIDSYSDDQIGGAVRAIHKGCRKALDEHFPVAPILDAREDDTVSVQAGFDPAAIRLLGNVPGAGAPPFSGVLRHHGWKAVRVELPSAPPADGIAAQVIAPAEVELP